MKTLINYSAIIVIMIAFLGVSTLNAQEWSKEQKEVWNVVENMFIKWQEKDIDAAFTNVHEKYLGWNKDIPLPTSKAKWKNSAIGMKDKISEAYFDIEPARILVHGNAAVVHYYFQFSFVIDGEKKHKVKRHGKWTEFFIKEEGKWMLLGDMTVASDE